MPYQQDYFSYSTNPRQFLQEAQEYNNHTETSGHRVPFSTYWYHEVSYRNLTPPQQKWYFYWRSQLRSGRFLPNDLSYIFLYTYEVLNLVGFEDAESAYQQLVRIWQHYRSISLPMDRYEWVVWNPRQYGNVRIHPIDRYLVDWIADFVRIHKLSTSAIDWYTSASSEGAVLTDLHLMVYSWLNSRKAITEMNNDVLFALASYDPTYNKFYQVFHQAFSLEDVYVRALSAIYSYLQSSGTDIATLFAYSQGTHVIKRTPFERALHTYSRKKIQILPIPLHVNHETLKVNLTGIIKYTDNLFRQRAGFSPKLRGFELPPEWATAIDRAFAIRPAPIEIDFSHASKISAESEAIRARLIDQTVEPSATNADEALGIEPPIDEKVSPQDHEQHQFRKLLHVFRQNKWQVTEDILQFAFEGVFVRVLIDQFNEWAYDLIGDTPIVEETDGQLTLLEDYREEISLLVDDTF
ncbi:MAG: hypothetical protein CL610_06385 [Anaerolineaceae bacterium]|nr:hypothetical protein [Anaerolineaceae bacterium]